MSGLEALGAAAAVIQLIDVSVRISKRLHEYNSKDLPKAFQEIKICLPAFTDILHHTKTAIEDEQLSESTRKVLDPLITECQKQLNFLHKAMEKTLPEAGDSSSVRVRKAIKSLHLEKDVNKADTMIQKYMKIMSDQAIAVNRHRKKLGTHNLFRHLAAHLDGRH